MSLTGVDAFGGEECTIGVDAKPLMVANVGSSDHAAISSSKSPPFLVVDLCRLKVTRMYCGSRVQERPLKKLQLEVSSSSTGCGRGKRKRLKFYRIAYCRMSFGLCNAPAIFQRCMMAIFTYMIEDIMEFSKEDFSVYANSFKDFLDNLCKVLKICEKSNWY